LLQGSIVVMAGIIEVAREVVLGAALAEVMICHAAGNSHPTIYS
jgi:hypothetical protein